MRWAKEMAGPHGRTYGRPHGLPTHHIIHRPDWLFQHFLYWRGRQDSADNQHLPGPSPAEYVWGLPQHFHEDGG
jgi:hypothetical protein